MKTKFALFLIYFFCVFTIYAQKKITIDDLPPQKEYNKTDDGQDITADVIKNNDLIISVDKTIKVKSVTAKKGETTIKLQQDIKQPTPGFLKYILPKSDGYDKKAIAIELITASANNSYNFKIVMGSSEADADLVKKNTDALQKCKDELKRKLNYKFINLDLPVMLDTCMPTGCYPCNDGAVVYDFASNTITNKNTVKIGDPLTFRIKNVNPFLYDVTISDTALTFNQNANDILNLLNGENSLNALEGSNKNVSALNNIGNECTLTLKEKILVATIELAKELSQLKTGLQNLSPYYDTYCYKNFLKTIKNAINDNITKYFGADANNIYSFTDIVSYLKINQDTSKPDVASALDDEYQKLFTSHFAYIYKIPEVQNVDEVDFLFNILPKNKDAALPVLNKGTIKVYTKGGFKVDVSSGLYYAFNMNDELYSVRADSTKNTAGGDSINFGKLYKEKQGNGEFGFSSFLHFYPRAGGIVNISGVIGAGVSFKDKPQLRYFAGVGILLGRDDRIAINGGAVFGNINQLSSQYTKDNSGNFNNLSFAEAGKDPIYVKHFVIKPFLSITYNLSFLKKKSETQIASVPANSESQNANSAKSDTITATNSCTKSGKVTQQDAGNATSNNTNPSSGSAETLLKNASKIKIKK